MAWACQVGPRSPISRARSPAGATPPTASPGSTPPTAARCSRATTFELAGRTLTRATLAQRRAGGPWRWAELLPVADPARRLHLGEGSTPLLPASRLGAALGAPRLAVKAEGLNPTGSFKARGMAVAVSRAIDLGAPSLVAPSAGNAGGALAAYGAAGGVPVTVVMPSDVPVVNRDEALAAGARVLLLDGADRRVRRRCPADRRRGGRVRPLDDARALPGGGQADDGPRARRGAGLAARRDRLPHRQRHRHRWSPCRRRAARRWCGRSSAGRPRWSRGRARRRARAAWARRPRWATGWSSRRCGRPAAPRSR